MEFTEFEKSLLIEAIAKQYRNSAEIINECNMGLGTYPTGVQKEIERVLGIHSLKIEKIKELANKLNLDIAFL